MRGIERLPGAGAAALIAAVVVPACGALFRAPDVRIVGVRVVALGITSGTAELELEVTNPNDGTLEIQGVHYRLQVEAGAEGDDAWQTLGEGYHSEGVSLAAEKTTRVTVAVPFDYEAVGTAIRSLMDRGEVAYRLDGDVWVEGPLGRTRVPIRTRGTLSP